MSARKNVGDMKAGLTSGARPKLSINGKHAAIYQCRGTEYGADKYARGNYHGPAPEGITPEARIMGYIDAIMRHCTEISDAYNRAAGTGGDVRAAIALPDTMAGGGFPASMLPHLAHILAGAGIAVECAVADGLIPADPGQPWKVSIPDGYRERTPVQGSGDGLPQKDNPAAERERVASLSRMAAEVASEFKACEIDAACSNGCDSDGVPAPYFERFMALVDRPLGNERRYLCVPRDQVNGRPAAFYEDDLNQEHVDSWHNGPPESGIEFYAEDPAAWPADVYPLAVVDTGVRR